MDIRGTLQYYSRSQTDTLCLTHPTNIPHTHTLATHVKYTIFRKQRVSPNTPYLVQLSVQSVCALLWFSDSLSTAPAKH